MSRPTDILLAVDGGGTTTRTWIVRTDGSVLASGGAGGSNVFELGVDASRRMIAEATTAAWRAAELPGEKPCAFLAVFAGIAGAGAPEDQRSIVSALAAEFGVSPENVRADHDLRIALAGALAGAPGVVVVAGTGSAAYGRSAAGEVARAGGWGPVLDDGGSGHWLGVQAMRAVIHMLDGREGDTVLTEKVFAALGVSSPREMLNRLQPTHPQHLQRAQIAALAPLVVEAADAGDSCAGEILDRGARELAGMVDAVVRRLYSFGGGGVRVAAAGGLIEKNASYFSRVAAKIASHRSDLRLERPQLPSVGGAAVLALELAGATIDDDVRVRLAAGPAASLIN